MKTRTRRAVKPRTLSVPLMAAELALSSWATIVRRSWMIAGGQCSLDERVRMVTEKSDAFWEAAFRLAKPGANCNRLMEPYLRRTRANARRLRR